MYYNIINNNKEKWILLLHCIGSNMNIFSDYIEDLSKEYNIILVDLPGHGKSNNIEEFTLNGVANEIKEILDMNSIQKVDIWGISLGAIVANEFAKLNSNKIGIMVLEGAAFGLKNKMYLKMFNLFNKIKFLLPSKIYINLFVNLVISGKNRRKIINIMKEHKSIANVKAIKLWLSIMNDEYINNIYINMQSNNKRLYLMGKKDRVFIDSIVDNVKENLNNKIIILENSSHLCHLDEHIDICNIIFDYLT